MKYKNIIFLILSFIIISCTSTNDTYSKSTVKIGKTEEKNKNNNGNNDEYLIEKRMTELEKLQEKTLISGSMEEIDNVILQNSLLKAFNVWKGTKYLWGGDSNVGIDCSALTRRIYRAVFSYELPRLAIDQANHGRKISRSDLKPGDILYFRPEGRVNHTAVYLGNSLFLNASTSQGVVISSLESNYWGKYFKYGVRVDKARG